MKNFKIKNRILFLVIISTLGIFGAQDAKAEHEAGVVLGTVTGFSGMFDLGGNNGIGATLAWGPGSNTSIIGDYLFNNARSWGVNGLNSPLELYYGLGFRLMNINSGTHNGKVAFGPHAPIGLATKFRNPDITLFGELALALDVTPASSVDVMAGIGVRIRF